MKLSLLILVILISGCSKHVAKDWQATGGSRGDATVRLSYQFLYHEKPILDEQQAISVATKRCKAWGYSSAEAFGGVITKCNHFEKLLGCTNTFVTKEYQCIGLGNIDNNTSITPQRQMSDGA